MRSPLHIPASTHGRLAATEFQFVIRPARILFCLLSEAEMRSPLHIPAPTHGHLAATELEQNFLVSVAAITNSVRVQR
jgi:hypothetical protein